MPVISVINRKGGSGKSTMATHLAAWLAASGTSVMLGDVDRQQSTRAWLKRRDPALPAIVPWTIDQKNVLKPPAGVTHVVLDTPGGIQGFDLAKVVMSTDAIVVPVCNSMFDRESAALCLTELMAMPRVASGRCRIGIVGMRLDARTRAAQVLSDWAEAMRVPFLGVLRETQWYVKSLETGQTVFDLRGAVHATDHAQWEPILEWLRPVVFPVERSIAATVSERPHPSTTHASQASIPKVDGERILASRAASLMPAQDSFLSGDRLSSFASTPLRTQELARNDTVQRSSPPGIPQYLLRA